MKDLKSKNIFSTFLYDRKNLTINNIIKYFGKRIIDLFMTLPLGIVKENLIKELTIKFLNQIVTVDLIVEDYQRKYNRRSPFKVLCKDKFNQKINILYFNLSENQIKNFLIKNKIYRITGKLEFSNNSFQIIHPTNIFSKENLKNYEVFYPEYDLSRKKINKKIFRHIINKNISILENFSYPKEWISKSIILRENWSSLKDSLINIHKPQRIYNQNELEHFRRRIAFDELLSSYLTFSELKKKFNFYKNDIAIKKLEYSKKIIKTLSFNLTLDQKKTLKEIENDLFKKSRMYRLLQGDVGSGKTIVSLLSAANVINSGFQVVLMAPTEILAKQHYEYFCQHMPEYKKQICLLTGKTKSKEKIYTLISNNCIKILIGTHSVYNDKINFSNLGLIIIDEQHKFGVKQRIKLLEKSKFCHTLIMSATPIPRSLSFVIYGEISISDIRSKPSERKNVVTSVININKLDELVDGVRRKLKKNEQVFWVLPTIDEDLKNNETVLTRYNFLNKLFKNRVTMIHGKMKKDLLEKSLENFKNRNSSILVSTTMVEVGVNIPTATLMIIERSEMFGLAQLHQLRGRISRGSLQGNCVLIHSDNLSDSTKKRLSILKNCDDGFEIAERDLEIRGAGDFFGTNQSGNPFWKFFKPSQDKKLIIESKLESERLVNSYLEHEKQIEFLRGIFYKDENFMNYFSV